MHPFSRHRIASQFFFISIYLLYTSFNDLVCSLLLFLPCFMLHLNTFPLSLFSIKNKSCQSSYIYIIIGINKDIRLLSHHFLFPVVHITLHSLGATVLFWSTYLRVMRSRKRKRVLRVLALLCPVLCCVFFCVCVWGGWGG